MFANTPLSVPAQLPSPTLLSPIAREDLGTPTLCGSAATSATAVQSISELPYLNNSEYESEYGTSHAIDAGAVFVSPIVNSALSSAGDSTSSQFSSIALQSLPAIPPVPMIPGPLPVDNIRLQRDTAADCRKQPNIFTRALLAMRGVRTVRRLEGPRKLDLLD